MFTSPYKLAHEDNKIDNPGEDISVGEHLLDHDDVDSEVNEIQEHIEVVMDSNNDVDTLTDTLVSLESDSVSDRAIYSAAITYNSMCSKHDVDMTVSLESDQLMTLSTEGVKELVIKLVEAIKIVITKIINSIRKLWIKIQILFNNDKRVVDGLGATLKSKIEKHPDPKEVTAVFASVFANNKNTRHKLYRRVAGIYLMSTKRDIYFPTMVNTYLKLLSTTNEPLLIGENGRGLEGLGIEGMLAPSDIAKYLSTQIPNKKNDIPLYKVMIVGVKGPVLYVLLQYYTQSRDKKTNLLLDYKTVRLDGLIGGDKITTEINLDSVTKEFLVMPEFTLHDINVLIKEVTTISEKIKSEYNEMNKRIALIEKFLADTEHFYKQGESKLNNTDQVLRNSKHLSALLPKMYLDRMSSLLYMNKTAIMILSAANRGMNNISINTNEM